MLIQTLKEIKRYFIFIFNSINITLYIVNDYFIETNGKFKLSFILFPLTNIYSIALKIKIGSMNNDKKLSLHMQAVLIYNNFETVTIQSDHIIKLIGKYILKVNSSLRYGYYTVNPVTGIVQFKVKSSFKLNENQTMNWDNFRNILKTNLSTIFSAIRIHIYKILILINLMSQKVMDNPQKYPQVSLLNNSKRLSADIIEHLLNMKLSLRECIDFKENLKDHREFRRHFDQPKLNMNPSTLSGGIVTQIKLKSVNLNQKTLLQEGGFSKIFAIPVEFTLDFSDYPQNIIQMQSAVPQNIPHQIQHPNNQDHRNGLKSAVNSSNGANNSHSIQVHDPQLSSQGPNVQQRLTPQQLQMLQERRHRKYLVFKEDKCDQTTPKEKSRICHEKEVLNVIGKKESPYVAKFYNDKSYVDSLIMELYPHNSLDQFKQAHDTIGLTTKIWFCLQIATGLKFLIDNGIYHLDLKPGNILISKNFVTKLIDFGESLIISKQRLEEHKPGRTFPYAPPELLQDPPWFSQKNDVFSFGALLCEILFDQMLIDFKKSSLQHVHLNYQKNQYKIKLFESNCQYYGPKHFMKLCRLMILICTEYENNKRACFSWLIIFLKEALNYIEKMY